MAPVTFSKPLFIWAAVAGTVLTGSSLTLRAKVNIIKKMTGIEDREALLDDPSPILEEPKHDVAILQQGNTVTNLPLKEGEQKIKCQLEDDSLIEPCSLSKITVPDRKWVNLSTLKNMGFTSHINNTYIPKTKTSYKVRVSEAFINNWKKNQGKNLKVFGVGDETKDSLELLKTLSPTLSITDRNQFGGKIKYLVGNFSSSTISLDSGSIDSIETNNKIFKCALPSSSKETYQNCNFYLFDDDADASTAKRFDDKSFKTPLTKAQTIKRNFHYLIELDEEQEINPSQYQTTTPLKVQIYGEESKNALDNAGVMNINFTFLSQVVLLWGNSNIDLALIL